MLQQFISENRESILSKWINLTINTYTPEMVGFLKKEKNQFSNPVRNTIVSSLTNMYDGILNGKSKKEIYPELEEIIKLRAVQDFSPSEALSFIFGLKKIVHKELESSDLYQTYSNDFRIFEENIDSLVGLAFDIYAKCRTKVYEIRIAEIKSQSQRVFDLLGKKQK